MKIAFVKQKYSEFGGAERYLAALIKHFARSNHEIHLFASEWKINKKESDFTSRRIVLHKVPIIRGLSFLEVLSFALNARRMLEREEFDIIHSFERTLYQDIYRASDGCHREWLIQRQKIDPWYKFFLHKINPLHLSILWIEKKIFREGKARKIVAISKRGKDEIVKHYDTPPKKIKVVYNAIDTNRFDLPDREKIRNEVRHFLGISQDIRVLLFVGSGFMRKGLSFAIRALARLDSEVRLMVIGHDRMNPYRVLAKKEGVEKRVIFLGPLADVERYYCASDLFIFPTIYEPFGNVCLEAMAAGIPLVTSRICGGSELLDEGINGYIIDNPTDPVEIAYKIERGLMLERKAIVDYNRQVLLAYSWKRYLEEMSVLYEDLYQEKMLSHAREKKV